MFHRLISPSRAASFFLFGPRGTGKTTFLKSFFCKDSPLWIDLLDPETEDRYCRSPGDMSREIEAKKPEWVVIDEVQKAPRLLDLAHSHIERSGVKFALTGSSPRKLKRGAANLLAGRAFVNESAPLTHVELGGGFDLDQALQWGGLPKPVQLADPAEKADFLRAYATAYLKEEVWAEHVVRRLDPFRRFLEAAAQSSGGILNYSNIARDVGADTKTVQSYFEVLEDTLVAVLLEPYHGSIRKRQRANPKFYLFDTGVQRALERTLTGTLSANTYAYGRAFEQFIVLEAHRLSRYRKRDYRFSYLRTKDDAEIDLVIERPGMPPALVEIKSAEHVDERHSRPLERLAGGFGKAEAFVFSRDPRPKRFGSVLALPWEQGFVEIGLSA